MIYLLLNVIHSSLVIQHYDLCIKIENTLYNWIHVNDTLCSVYDSNTFILNMLNTNRRFNNIRVMCQYLNYEHDTLHKTKAIIEVMYQISNNTNKN